MHFHFIIPVVPINTLCKIKALDCSKQRDKSKVKQYTAKINTIIATTNSKDFNRILRIRNP